MIFRASSSIGAGTKNVAVRITAVDFQPATLELAMERSKTYPEITFLESDVLRFVPDTPADFVFCSLALHHFADDAAIRLLRHARTMAQGRVLVADLERTDLGIAGIYLLTACVFREPMTRFDARLSIRRAFSFREMRQAGLRRWLETVRSSPFPGLPTGDLARELNPQ